MPKAKRASSPEQSQAPKQAPLQPNMLVRNARATSSTFDQVNLDHCVFRNSNFTNTLLAQVDFEGAALRYERAAPQR